MNLLRINKCLSVLVKQIGLIQCSALLNMESVLLWKFYVYLYTYYIHMCMSTT